MIVGYVDMSEYARHVGPTLLQTVHISASIFIVHV